MFIAQDWAGWFTFCIERVIPLCREGQDFRGMLTLQRKTYSGVLHTRVEGDQKSLLTTSRFTTADVYTHTSTDVDRRAALALEQAIFGDLFQVVPRFGPWNNDAAPN